MPTVWPDVSVMGANNLRRVVGYDFHHGRSVMCQVFWRLLQLFFVFELMPCTLEALTVIKTFCLGLTIPTCWRIGESKKPGVFPKKSKTNPTKNKTKTQEDTRRTR